jgi:hypothetical protein
MPFFRSMVVMVAVVMPRNASWVCAFMSVLLEQFFAGLGRPPTLVHGPATGAAGARRRARRGDAFERGRT